MFAFQIFGGAPQTGAIDLFQKLFFNYLIIFVIILRLFTLHYTLSTLYYFVLYTILKIHLLRITKEVSPLLIITSLTDLKYALFRNKVTDT